jgi:hypothetical protein
LEKTLVGIHLVLSKVFSDPAWELSRDEAEELSETASNVARHYNATIAPKTLDWIALIGVLAMIYGSRIAPMIVSKFAKGKATNNQRQAPPEQSAPSSFDMPPLPTIGMQNFTSH